MMMIGLLEPDNMCSRGSRALAMRFVELGTIAVSLIQSRRAYCWNPNRDRALCHALVTSMTERLTDLPRLLLKNVLFGLIMTVAKKLLGSLFCFGPHNLDLNRI